jgi:hypothetical protein
LAAIGLSAEDLTGMFRVSKRSAHGWTTGARKVPKWLMPALQIYRLLPPAARRAALESLVYDRLPAGADRVAGSNRPRANMARHPFARIEEL